MFCFFNCIFCSRLLNMHILFSCITNTSELARWPSQGTRTSSPRQSPRRGDPFGEPRVVVMINEDWRWTLRSSIAIMAPASVTTTLITPCFWIQYIEPHCQECMMRCEGRKIDKLSSHCIVTMWGILRHVQSSSGSVSHNQQTIQVSHCHSHEAIIAILRSSRFCNFFSYSRPPTVVISNSYIDFNFNQSADTIFGHALKYISSTGSGPLSVSKLPYE